MDPWIVTMMLSGSLFLAGVALAGFLWAIKSGQFDDLDGPGEAILMDDDAPKPQKVSKHSQ